MYTEPIRVIDLSNGGLYGEVYSRILAYKDELIYSIGLRSECRIIKLNQKGHMDKLMRIESLLTPELFCVYGNFLYTSIRSYLRYDLENRADHVGGFDLSKAISKVITCDKYLLVVNINGESYMFDPLTFKKKPWTEYSNPTDRIPNADAIIVSKGLIYMAPIGEHIYVLKPKQDLSPELVRKMPQDYAIFALTSDDVSLYSVVAKNLDRVITKRGLLDEDDSKKMSYILPSNVGIPSLMVYRDLILAVGSTSIASYYRADLSAGYISIDTQEKISPVIWNSCLMTLCGRKHLAQWSEPSIWSSRNHRMFGHATRVAIRQLWILNRGKKGGLVSKIPLDIVRVISEMIPFGQMYEAVLFGGNSVTAKYRLV